jgi:hypothetical protein
MLIPTPDVVKESPSAVKRKSRAPRDDELFPPKASGLE